MCFIKDVDVILDDGADGEARRAEVDHQMGAVDPALKMQLRKLTAHLVRRQGESLGKCEGFGQRSGALSRGGPPDGRRRPSAQVAAAQAHGTPGAAAGQKV
jgi:hypothetical protein